MGEFDPCGRVDFQFEIKCLNFALFELNLKLLESALMLQLIFAVQVVT